MNYNFLDIKFAERFAIVTINRVEKHNALNSELMSELIEFFTSVRKPKNFQLKGIILTGAGEKAFVAGADIKEMSELDADAGEAFGALGQRMTTAIEECALPVVACVNGFAFGGGCELAMSADFIYAVESAKFGQPEVNLGLIPGFGGCVRLQRYVGPGLAKELIYTGRQISAREANALGLVNRVFTNREEMLSAAKETLQLISKKSSVAIGICKEIINAAEGENTENALKIEKDGFRRIFTTADKAEGVTAFLEKRSAKFLGR